MKDLVLPGVGGVEGAGPRPTFPCGWRPQHPSWEHSCTPPPGGSAQRPCLLGASPTWAQEAQVRAFLTPSHAAVSPHATQHSWPLSPTHTPLSPPGQTVTDRHPVTLAESHRSWELGRTQAHPPSGPHPSRDLPGPSCPGGRGGSAAGAIWRKHGYLQRFIFKPSLSPTGAAAPEARVEPWPSHASRAAPAEGRWSSGAWMRGT